MNEESDPELRDDDEDEYEAEPFTLAEYEQALVFGLAGVSRIADILSGVLLRQEDSRRFARQITELEVLHTLIAGYAGRLADHYEVKLEAPFITESETAPVGVRPIGSNEVTHGGATIRLGRPGTPYLTDGEQLSRRLANAFVQHVPAGVTLGVSDGGLWFARGPAGDDLGASGSIPMPRPVRRRHRAIEGNSSSEKARWPCAALRALQMRRWASHGSASGLSKNPMPKYEIPSFISGSARAAKLDLSSNPLKLKCRNWCT